MPNRIIKESICTSEEIDKLDSDAECLFYRIMVNCDDYGLMDARRAILKAKCYPLKTISDADISFALIQLVTNNLIEMYTVKGREYLHVLSWGKHQQIRARRAKHPLPTERDDVTCKQPISGEIICVPNPIQSNPNQSNPVMQETTQLPAVVETKEIAKAKEPKREKVGFDYKTGLWTGLQENPAMIESWIKAYPGVDLRFEFGRMRAWLMSNTSNRKTNLERFANNWLSKAQDRARQPIDKTFAERKQDFLNQQAEKFYQPLITVDDKTLGAWGLGGDDNGQPKG